MFFNFPDKGCCVQLKALWHQNGSSIGLSVKPAGVKNFVDIVDTETLLKNVQ
jgi:hypothetical protein